MEDIVIVGSSKYARLLKYYIENENNKSQHVVAFAIDENFFSGADDEISIEDLENDDRYSNLKVVLGIGYTNMNTLRQSMLQRFRNRVEDYIHPMAYVSPKAQVGRGNIFYEGVIIQPNTCIGDGNVFQAGTTLMHDSTIKDGCFLSANCVINGRVEIGDRCFIGSGAIVRNRVKIGNEVLVGAGSYVAKDITDKSVIVPARSVVLDKTSLEIEI